MHLPSRISWQCSMARCSRKQRFSCMASSVGYISASATSVRKPSEPRFTPRIGMFALASARAAASSVPSPPSTMANAGLRCAASSRSTASNPGTCAAVCLSTMMAYPCACNHSPKRTITGANSTGPGLEKMATSFSGLAIIAGAQRPRATEIRDCLRRPKSASL